MEIKISAIGRQGRDGINNLFDEYRGRFDAQARNLGWRPLQFEARDIRPANVMKERDWLMSQCEGAGVVIALDERGKDLSSLAFADKLQGHAEKGHGHVQILIGGAEGFGDALRARADLLLSMGRMTWPHEMVRAMLAEQLFRAASILSNHPYHREG